MTSRWNVPDWRAAENYGSTDSWDLDRWRWEFTRRRADYRQDFTAALGRVSNPAAAVGGPGRQQPGAIPHSAAEKYGLLAFFDPRHCEWEGGLRPRWLTGLRPLLELLDPDELLSLRSQRNRAMLSFDLTKPIRPQIEEAERGLAWMQEAAGAAENASTKLHPAKWLRNLRVIDARDAGASWSEIVAAVPMAPADQTVDAARDAEKAGRRGLGI